MTLEELREIEEELHDLKVNKRTENAKRIMAAREKGDLSDNPEYDAAKEEQRVIEDRIDEIMRILKENF